MSLKIVIAAVVLSCTQVSAWDYSIFVRQWTPTVCATSPCTRQPLSRFTIHGLWPESFDGSWPQYCDNEPFSMAAVADLLPEMRAQWPSMWHTDAAFWTHEWRRHGTCESSVFATQHDFFAAVLQLHRQFDLMAALQSLDIKADTSYDQVDLEEKLKGIFGRSVRVHCEEKGGGGGNINEIWMCVDRQLQLIDCPQNIARRCGSVVLPSIHRTEELHIQQV